MTSFWCWGVVSAYPRVCHSAPGRPDSVLVIVKGQFSRVSPERTHSKYLGMKSLSSSSPEEVLVCHEKAIFSPQQLA